MSGNGNSEDYSAESWAKMMHWQTIWLRTIAKAWSDDEFKAKLLEYPRDAIGQAFNYEIPRTLKLSVKEADSDSVLLNKRGFHDWSDLPPMELTMYLPPAPKADVQAIAIADYAESGRTYPFTCC